MRPLAVLQVVGGLCFLVASPVGSEMSVLITAWMAVLGLAAIGGGIGLWRGTRLGWRLSIGANLGLAVPTALLAIVVAVDFVRGQTSYESSGIGYVLGACVLPALAIAFLWTRRVRAI